MAAKKPAITVTVARELKLTAAELTRLKRAFKMDLTNVLRARPRGGGNIVSILPDVNVGGGASGSKKTPAKKSGKKTGGASKK